MNESDFGVIYRKGLAREDYDEAIRDLIGARDQQPGGWCGVCSDSGHTAEYCRHNPLVMARRGASKARSWRCFHCNEVFTTPEAAEEHFGKREDEIVRCLRGVGDARHSAGEADCDDQG